MLSTSLLFFGRSFSTMVISIQNAAHGLIFFLINPHMGVWYNTAVQVFNLIKRTLSIVAIKYKQVPPQIAYANSLSWWHDGVLKFQLQYTSSGNLFIFFVLLLSPRIIFLCFENLSHGNRRVFRFREVRFRSNFWEQHVRHEATLRGTRVAFAISECNWNIVRRNLRRDDVKTMMHLELLIDKFVRQTFPVKKIVFLHWSWSAFTN